MVALAALVVATGGTALAAAEIAGSDEPETVLQMRVAKDGKLIGAPNDGTETKAGVGIYEISFNRGSMGSKLPLAVDGCAIFATPRVQSDSSPSTWRRSAEVVTAERAPRRRRRRCAAGLKGP